MLFSLTNLKRRSVRDADGELAVVPKLLHGRNALKLLEQAIEVFDGYVGRARAEYDPRALEAVLADYRLARCVEACLLTYYAFVQPEMGSVLTAEEMQSLTECGLGTPSQMRLAVWDATNERHGGFVPPEERGRFMEGLAEEWGIRCEPGLVDSLLALDSDASAVLTPTRERPKPREVMRQFNRGAVQTLLAHSNKVTFRLSSVPGAALKRAYFMAKRRGVLVEVEGAQGGYVLTLFGPEQAFGGADKYGQRLADVAISLLRSLLAEGEVQVEATAELTLHDRVYRFHVDEAILGRLEYAPEPESGGVRRVAEARAGYSVGSVVESAEDGPEGNEPAFDSMLEAALYREHRSLEKQGYTHGWRLQREPDPLLAPGVVLIPDFAFLRGDTRVFMEIAGFWTPGYRERKLQKLRVLASQAGEEAALIIAAPNDAAPSFAGLPYPVVPYKNQVRVTDLLAVLDARYGQREERHQAGAGQVGALRGEAASKGFVPEKAVAEALQAFTRTELLASAQQLQDEQCRYVPGVGLLSVEMLGQVRERLASLVEEAEGQRVYVEEAARQAAVTLGSPVDIEALVQQWPELGIERPSLFEAFLVKGVNV